MAKSIASIHRSARRVIERDGLLLMTDARLPSLVSHVTGAPPRGSWWGLPEGALIFNVGNALSDDDDIAAAKLVNGKVTFVHARLWPALAAGCRSAEAWQTAGLTAADKAVLAALRKAGTLRTDALPRGLLAKHPDAAKRLKALEPRLLFVTGQVHTESGAHATTAVTWAAWLAERGLGEGALPGGAAGQTELATALAAALGDLARHAKLPWRRKAGKS
jgi:hypothetical protein